MIMFVFTSRYLVSRKGLDDVVRNSQEGTRGNYAIVIKNLKSNDIFMQNEHLVFESASLYKLWVMGAVYKQIKEGKIKEDDILSWDISLLNNFFEIESPSLGELSSGVITLTVSDALHQMITISHNYSALMLVEKIGISNLKKFIQELGLKETFVDNHSRTTAYDLVIFFEKLYNGQIIDKKYSNKMIALLKDQQINDRIPRFLPKSISIGHKTGEIDNFKHDAGIVFAPKGDYIFIVLTKSESPVGAAERIATLSKEIFEFFQNRISFTGDVHKYIK